MPSPPLPIPTVPAQDRAVRRSFTRVTGSLEMDRPTFRGSLGLQRHSALGIRGAERERDSFEKTACLIDSPRHSLRALTSTEESVRRPRKAVAGAGRNRQSSSGVEQGTHKPLVAGSNPASGTTPKPQQTPVKQGRNPRRPVFSNVMPNRPEGCQTPSESRRFVKSRVNGDRVPREGEGGFGNHPILKSRAATFGAAEYPCSTDRGRGAPT